MSELKITASSNPSPLQVDTDGSVNITIEKSEKSIDVTSVEIVFFTGETERTLFSASEEHKPKISVNTVNWSIDLKKPQEEENLQESQKLFQCSNGNENKKLSEPLIFKITGLTSDVCGSAELRVSVNNKKEYLQTFTFEKSAAAFYLRNFITRKSSNIPITEFTRTDTIYFSWESNGTSYKLYDGRSEEPIYNSAKKNGNPVTSFEYKGIERDTTFILVAEKADGEDKLELIDRITVTISDPHIVTLSTGFITVNEQLTTKNIKASEDITGKYIKVSYKAGCWQELLGVNYIFRNVHSGLVLDVPYCRLEKKQMQLCAYHGAGNQRFIINMNDETKSYVTISTVIDQNWVLDVWLNESKEGALIYLHPYSETDSAEKFRPRLNADGSVTFLFRDNLAIDTESNEHKSSTLLILKKYDPNSNTQKWFLERIINIIFLRPE